MFKKLSWKLNNNIFRSNIKFVKNFLCKGFWSYSTSVCFLAPQKCGKTLEVSVSSIFPCVVHKPVIKMAAIDSFFFMSSHCLWLTSIYFPYRLQVLKEYFSLPILFLLRKVYVLQFYHFHSWFIKPTQSGKNKYLIEFIYYRESRRITGIHRSAHYWNFSQ